MKSILLSLPILGELISVGEPIGLVPLSNSDRILTSSIAIDSPSLIFLETVLKNSSTASSVLLSLLLNGDGIPNFLKKRSKRSIILFFFGLLSLLQFSDKIPINSDAASSLLTVLSEYLLENFSTFSNNSGFVPFNILCKLDKTLSKTTSAFASVDMSWFAIA